MTPNFKIQKGFDINESGPRDWYSGAAERAMAAPSAAKVPSILGQVPPIFGQSAPNSRPKCLS